MRRFRSTVTLLSGLGFLLCVAAAPAQENSSPPVEAPPAEESDVFAPTAVTLFEPLELVAAEPTAPETRNLLTDASPAEIPVDEAQIPGPGQIPEIFTPSRWPEVPVTTLPVVVRTEPSGPLRLYRDACLVRAPEAEAKLDAAQRKLFETVCRANRWFDGLFGDESPDAAQRVTGRVELGGVYSDYEGFDSKSRFAVRWQLPNLDRRLNAFVGRLNEDDVENDRSETIAMRSSFFDLEEEEEWLAGLGYSLPGNNRRKTDFQVAAKISSEPELLARARARWLFYPGERTALRFRLTGLFQNREGFGITGHFDVDQVLGPKLLLRWGGWATESEESQGTDWRSGVVLYQNLRGDHAIAWELFAEGETEDDVPLHEYGARIIYRQRFFVDGVYIVPVLGYSYPRRELDEIREGSGSVGLSLEIRFGRWLALR